MADSEQVDRVAHVLMDAWEAAEGKPVSPSCVATFADMARAIIAATPVVEITNELNKPSTCKVWQDGVLLFDGLSPPF